jgi:hypothetical protein
MALLGVAPWALGLLHPGWVTLIGLGVQQAARLADPRSRQRRWDLDVTWPALGLGVMAVVGLWASPDRAFSLPKFYGVLFQIGVFTAIISSLRSAPDRERWLWRAFLLYAALGIPLAVGSFLIMQERPTHSDFFQAVYDLRPRLTLPWQGPDGGPWTEGHPNQIAGVLTLFIPVYFALLLTRPWRAEPDGRAESQAMRPGLTALAVGGLLITGSVQALTLSRGGVLATVVGLLFVPVVARWSWTRFLVLVPAAIGLLIVGAAAFRAIPDPQQPQNVALFNFLQEVGSALQFDREQDAIGNLAYRVHLWHQVSSFQAEHLLTGIGLNALPIYIHGKDLPKALTERFWLVTHSHNLFLQISLDFGLPGVLFFLALLWLAAHQQWALVPPCVSVGLLGGLLSFVTHSTVDAVPIGAKPGVLMLVCLGILLGSGGRVCRLEKKDKSGGETDAPAHRR